MAIQLFFEKISTLYQDFVAPLPRQQVLSHLRVNGRAAIFPAEAQGSRRS
jgi:hypothetical protein